MLEQHYYIYRIILTDYYLLIFVVKYILRYNWLSVFLHNTEIKYVEIKCEESPIKKWICNCFKYFLIFTKILLFLMTSSVPVNVVYFRLLSNPWLNAKENK